MEALEREIEFQITQLQDRLESIRIQFRRAKEFRKVSIGAKSAAGNAHAYAKAMAQEITENALPVLKIYERLVMIEDLDKESKR